MLKRNGLWLSVIVSWVFHWSFDMSVWYGAASTLESCRSCLTVSLDELHVLLPIVADCLDIRESLEAPLFRVG
jgi:hypothetical protein